VLEEVETDQTCLDPCPTLAKLQTVKRKESNYMLITSDAVTELIKNPKRPFRKADDRPAKAQKHRYERRKVKNVIHQVDWSPDPAA